MGVDYRGAMPSMGWDLESKKRQEKVWEDWREQVDVEELQKAFHLFRKVFEEETVRKITWQRWEELARKLVM